MPDFLLENQFDGVVVGVDEVGRGPLAGPVVAASVVFLNQDIDFLSMLDDSKKLSVKVRQELFDKLSHSKDVIYDYAIISNEVIDEINIFNATKQAMLESVEKLSSKIVVSEVLVDGKYKMLGNKFSEQAVIKGDTKSCSIAAASIIAKVVRDKIMTDLGVLFPCYNWKKNVGYGTKEHIAAIFEYGITGYHRKSFAPIKNEVIKKYKKVVAC